MDPKLCTVSDQSTQGAISHGIAPRTSAKNSVAVGGRAFSRASRWSDATAAATAASVPLRTNHHNLGLSTVTSCSRKIHAISRESRWAQLMWRTRPRLQSHLVQQLGYAGPRILCARRRQFLRWCRRREQRGSAVRNFAGVEQRLPVAKGIRNAPASRRLLWSRSRRRPAREHATADELTCCWRPQVAHECQ